jgi:hypothetical protein
MSREPTTAKPATGVEIDDLTPEQMATLAAAILEEIPPSLRPGAPVEPSDPSKDLVPF